MTDYHQLCAERAEAHLEDCKEIIDYASRNDRLVVIDSTAIAVLLRGEDFNDNCPPYQTQLIERQRIAKGLLKIIGNNPDIMVMRNLRKKEEKKGISTRRWARAQKKRSGRAHWQAELSPAMVRREVAHLIGERNRLIRKINVVQDNVVQKMASSGDYETANHLKKIARKIQDSDEYKDYKGQVGFIRNIATLATYNPGREIALVDGSSKIAEAYTALREEFSGLERVGLITIEPDTRNPGRIIYNPLELEKPTRTLEEAVA